jgi:hypothetical protein
MLARLPSSANRLLIVTMLMAASPRIMGGQTIGPALKMLGWLSTLSAVVNGVVAVPTRRPFH